MSAPGGGPAPEKKLGPEGAPTEGRPVSEKAEAGALAAGPAPVPPAAPPAPSAAGAKGARLAAERTVHERLKAQFPLAVQGERVFAGQLWIDVAPEAIHHVLRFLRDDAATRMSMLTDLTCADYLKLPDYARGRFGVTYILYSLEHDVHARLKVWLKDGDPELPTATDLFKSANWAEREVYDLYGIKFKGHPNLKRILMPDDYEGHPLRKDYPLKGRGERDSFPVLTRRES